MCVFCAAIESVSTSESAFCRIITNRDADANDHKQTGFFIPESAAELLFGSTVKLGENREKLVKIKWQDDFTTNNRLVYRSQGETGEYYLTGFGEDFPFLDEDYVGRLLIIIKQRENYYKAFVLETDDDLEDFYDTFGVCITRVGFTLLHGRVINSMMF